MTMFTLNKRTLLLGATSMLAMSCAAAPEGATIVSTPWTHPGGPTPVAQHGKLRVQGNRIVGAHGRPVVLRGMSLFWSQWMPQFYNAECVRWLVQDWGCTVIRAAIALTPDGYREHPDREMAKARTVIQAAIDNGIYVVVDWHAHEPDPVLAARFFGQIATEFGAHPNVIYETFNEPLENATWAAVVKPYHEQVIPAIRATGADGLIVAGTPKWSQDVDIATADPLADTNTAYVLHYYAHAHRESLREKARVALARGAALFVTEYGTVDYTGDGPINHEQSQAWWDFLEENQISYLNWSICDKRESSATVVPGAPGTGGWTDAQLTPAGHYVRAQIRALNYPA